MANLPRSTIKVKGGRVISVAEWVLHDLEPHNTILIERQDGGFKAKISNPGTGGTTPVARTIKFVLAGLHPAVIAKYEAMFALRNTTPAKLKHRFPGYVVQLC